MLEARNAGKPIGDARGEMDMVAQTIGYYAGAPERFANAIRRLADLEADLLQRPAGAGHRSDAARQGLRRARADHPGAVTRGDRRPQARPGPGRRRRLAAARGSAFPPPGRHRGAELSRLLPASPRPPGGRRVSSRRSAAVYNHASPDSAALSASKIGGLAISFDDGRRPADRAWEAAGGDVRRAGSALVPARPGTADERMVR